MLQLFKQREDNTTGALESARALGEEKDKLLEQIDEKLSGARGRARETFEALSAEGMEAQRSSIESAQNEAVDINRNAKAELEAATEKARDSLKSHIETFAKQIVGKLVGA
jgi:F0F1-type ATP synthase membrane subunit b/b'